MVECFSLSVSLSLFLSVSLFRHLSTELPFQPSTYLPVYSCIYRSICLFTYLLNCLSFCLSSHSSIHLLLSVSFFFPSISSFIHVHSYHSPCSSFCFSISAEDASCTAPATKNASVQVLFKSPTPAIVFENATTPSRFSHFSTIHSTCHTKRRLNVQNVSETSVFNTFDFEMCFAPQRHALFRHLNFQKC